MSKHIHTKRLAADRTVGHLGAIRVMNNTGSQITKDSVVRIQGCVTSGGILRVVDVDTADDSGFYLVAGQNIDDGSDGVCYEWTTITMDTSSGAVDGDVYVSTTDGAVTLTPTGGPRVGKVLSVGSSGFVLLAPGRLKADGTVTISGTIATAAVATLFSVPVEVIAAPGAGKFIEVDRCHWFLDFATTAYDAAAAGDTLALHYTNGSGAAVVDAVAGNAIGAASADYHTIVRAVPELIPVANAAIVAAVQTGEWYSAAGDSPLKYEIDFRVRTLAFA